MTVKEFMASADDKKVGNFMNEIIAHGGLCKKFCRGCRKSRYDCGAATVKMLNSEIEECYMQQEG